jgi:hypothetical protein
VLLKQPFARAAQLQHRAVHDQVDGIRARARTGPSQRLDPAAQGGVGRPRKIEAEQGDGGADQPFSFPQGQVEHELRRQRRDDRQARIAWLAASGGPWLRLPGCDHRTLKPDSQTAGSMRVRIALGRVLNSMPLLRDVVTTRGIGFDFERHNTCLGQRRELARGTIPRAIRSQSVHHCPRRLLTERLDGDCDRAASSTKNVHDPGMRMDPDRPRFKHPLICVDCNRRRVSRQNGIGQQPSFCATFSR